MKHFCFFSTQNEGLCENEHQLSVAGKIKKHFNTNPKVNDTTAGVSVISVSYHEKRLLSLNLFSSEESVITEPKSG